MIIGIDIGTSNSSAAYLKDGKPEKIKPGTESDYSVPSAVYVKDDGTLLIGRAAIATRMKDPSRFKSNFKRDFGADKPYLLGGQEVSTQEIYTEYFRYFKQSAERVTGQEVSKAYITHPVSYSTAKKRQLEQAANYAGLLDVMLIDEPTAAALSFFIDNKPKNGEKLLIFDLGGGTLDLTLAEVTDGGLRLLTEPVGDESIGGADFDRLLYSEIVYCISKENDLSEALSNMRFSIELNGKCVEAKHNLSRDDSSLISIPFGFGEYIEHVVTRERFNNLILPKLDSACSLIEKITKNAGLTPAQINKVLFVGGSTRIPFVAKRVERVVGKTVLETTDPELAVCMGAVLHGTVQASLSSMQKNTSVYGNSPGNITSGGNVAIQGDWIYYSSILELYKIRKDGSGKTKLNERGFFHNINVYNDWVYYIIWRLYDDEIKIRRLEKVRTDGKELTLLSEIIGFGSSVCVVDDWIYYSSEALGSDENLLYKIRTNGEGKTKLGNDSVGWCYVTDGWVYYVNTSDSAKIYRMRTDGTGRTKIIDESSGAFNVVGDWVYYAASEFGHNLYKVRTDGTERTRLNDEGTNCLNVDGDWVYYRNGFEHAKLCKIRTNGTERTEILNVEIQSFSIFENWIYYVNDGTLYKVCKNGTKHQPIG